MRRRTVRKARTIRKKVAKKAPLRPASPKKAEPTAKTAGKPTPVMEAKPPSDIAFTASVKAMQSRRGSRAAYEKMEARGGFQTKITPGLIAFLTEVDTAYLATANSGIY
jgi:hypothetical protein